MCALLRLRFPFYQNNSDKDDYCKNTTQQENILNAHQNTEQGKISFNHEKKHYIKELEGAAIIREVHTYGLTLNIGKREEKAPQHLGLGKKLIQKAENIAKKYGYKKIAVISAIGTREYYRKIGYKIKGSYMVKNLSQ
ncbi:GNAT family N-acetyltransferase [Candidatus Peregrinibacteria bacterium]|nr:GNAT family N-acetyltransferase [Candidatus Peregrinibacteria bacterium]